MRFLIVIAAFLLFGCSHTYKSSNVVEAIVQIPEPIVEMKGYDSFETDVPVFNVQLPYVQLDKEAPTYFTCGLYIPEVPELVNLSFEDIEKDYDALMVTSSYKKWIPIEGEPKTVLVFNFQK